MAWRTNGSNLFRPLRGPVAAAFILAFAILGQGQEDATLTTEVIERAWNTRQDHTRAARFTWKEEHFWPKGAISSTLGSQLQRRVPEAKGRTMPPADSTIVFFYRLVLDGDKVRFEYEGKEWANKTQDFRDVKYLSVFDGKTPKELYPLGVGHGTWPQAVIRAEGSYADAGLAALRPLLMVCRPFSPALQPTTIRNMTLRPQRKTINGRPCVELFEGLPGNTSLSLWMDPERDFSLVRRLRVNDGRPQEQIDITYSVFGNVGWVPSGWKVVSNNQVGALFFSKNAVVTHVDFNIATDSGVFDMEFPPGARVQDERTMENYILRPDGSKRPILSKDIGATYEQMLNSPPGHALESGHSPLLGRWVLVVAVATALSALVILIWRRLRVANSANHRRGS